MGCKRATFQITISILNNFRKMFQINSMHSKILLICLQILFIQMQIIIIIINRIFKEWILVKENRKKLSKFKNVSKHMKKKTLFNNNRALYQEVNIIITIIELGITSLWRMMFPKKIINFTFLHKILAQQRWCNYIIMPDYIMHL